MLCDMGTPAATIYFIWTKSCLVEIHHPNQSAMNARRLAYPSISCSTDTEFFASLTSLTLLFTAYIFIYFMYTYVIRRQQL